jgi:hypothetical protein
MSIGDRVELTHQLYREIADMLKTPEAC